MSSADAWIGIASSSTAIRRRPRQRGQWCGVRTVRRGEITSPQPGHLTAGRLDRKVAVERPFSPTMVSHAAAAADDADRSRPSPAL